MDVVRVSRKVSRALRHEPAEFGLELQRGGWASTAALARAVGISRAELDEVVAASARFELDSHGLRIRAAHGHSVGIDLDLSPSCPPPRLWHGTVWSAVGSILADGLSPMRRRYVHLSGDEDIARRRGKPVLICVDAVAAHANGLHFYLTHGGVWLTDAVPARFLSPSPR